MITGGVCEEPVISRESGISKEKGGGLNTSYNAL